MRYREDYLFQSENIIVEEVILFDIKKERKKEGRLGGRGGRGKEEEIKIYRVEFEKVIFYQYIF